MAKIITFSRVFPVYHPRRGEPTNFVEKVWESIRNEKNIDSPQYHFMKFESEIMRWKTFSPKHHTIREGKRFKVGDKFSPRVWSGKPYNSKQIIIAPDIEVKKVWDIKVEKDHYKNTDGSITIYTKIIINGFHRTKNYEKLAINDGLSVNDLCNWFIKPFEGQIICWNENINY